MAALTASALTCGDGLRTVELAVRSAMIAVGRSLLEQLLSTRDGHAGQWIDCGSGHRAQFVGYRDKSLHTVLGVVRVRRAYYHCRNCNHGVVPRDQELGVVGQTLSPGLRRMVARVAAVEPFASAADLLADLAGVRLNTKRVERRAEADGLSIAAAIDNQYKAILDRSVSIPPPADAADMLYIAIDGTGVPVVPAAAQDRQGKGEDGRARTREVKLACLFTQTKVDDDGRPVRDPDTSTYLASFAPADQFAPLVHAEARRRGCEHIRQLVVLGDGATWIWNLATKIFPEATQIVDIYHAREHLHDITKLLAGVLGDDQHTWLAERLANLDDGAIETLVKATTQLPIGDTTVQQIDTALDYFKKNAQRMRYAYYRGQGMFIGSGTVEAGCKTLIGQRLKLSGMRWNLPGATGVITLRTQRASNRWDQIWPDSNNQIPVPAAA
ncbi:MAG TPA: ISKra4 family transposase [Mycobacterium sp.]